TGPTSSSSSPPASPTPSTTSSTRSAPPGPSSSTCARSGRAGSGLCEAGRLRPVTIEEREAMHADRSPDLVRTTLQLLFLGALVATSLWILRPFLVALAWATMIVVATWPVLLDAERWLGGRRPLAVAAMTILLALTLLVPVYFGITAVAGNAQQLVEWSKSLGTFAIPPPPDWLAGVPVIGGQPDAPWEELGGRGPG